MALGLQPDAQERVLAAANQSRWTVKALQSAIAREKAHRTTRGGRRPQPVVSKSLRAVNKCLEEHINVLHDIEIVSKDELQQSVQLLQQARAYLESLAGSLQHALNRRDGESVCSESVCSELVCSESVCSESV
jgi:hypothetical protein